MCSIGSVVFVEMTRPSIYNVKIPYVSRVVIFSGMYRKVNIVIIQRCSTTRLLNEPHSRLFDRGGVSITPTTVCIFCRTDFVANLMTTEKPDFGQQTRICSIIPGK